LDNSIFLLQLLKQKTEEIER